MVTVNNNANVNYNKEVFILNIWADMFTDITNFSLFVFVSSTEHQSHDVTSTLSFVPLASVTQYNLLFGLHRSFWKNVACSCGLLSVF